MLSLNINTCISSTNANRLHPYIIFTCYISPIFFPMFRGEKQVLQQISLDRGHDCTRSPLMLQECSRLILTKLKSCRAKEKGTYVSITQITLYYSL